MKKNALDPRINVKDFSLGKYLFVFLVIIVLCGSYALIFYSQQNTNSSGVYIFASMVMYLVVISILLTFVFAFFHKKFLSIPMHRLSQAARLVASGDFSVRLTPQRKDGMIDEYEALCMDFNTMVEELASTEMLKNDFVSNVSHELKTPLAVIQNYATMLQNRNLTQAEYEEYTQTILDASKGLSEMVGNILMLSRLENQKIPVQKRPYNLSEQLSRCALGFETVWEEKDIELDADLDQNLLIEHDEGLMDIVWNNLLSNALKFTDPCGTITLTAQQQEGQAVVAVSDTGCGMDEATVRHIFDKFYQGDTSHKTKGNGLGLAIVKKILDLSECTISVNSVPGEGTSVTVALPLYQQ